MHAHGTKVSTVVGKIMHQQHNLFGYPNEERGLWLELEGNGNQQYLEKTKADTLYFVGCKASFLIASHQHALNILKELEQSKVDFAILGPREWCCGMPLKRLGLNKEFERCKEHNLKELKDMEAKKIIFGCESCYSTWKRGYHPEGIELILHSYPA
jgi:Fe-S oxidoreductase